jgi:hypothetical protein
MEVTMKDRKRMALSLLAALLVAVPAGANPILPPTLLPHYAPEIAFSTDPPEGGWSQAYNAYAVTSPEDLNLRIDVEDSRGVVWYVLVALNSSTEWCGVEFGLGAYDVRAFVPTSFVGLASCTNPPWEYSLTDVGSLGINTDGTATPPTQFRACCRDSVCTVESEIGCEMGGGAWIPEEYNCIPGLCTTPIREVTWGEIKALYKK